ncbi:MAG: TetR/AcrR family transcriptional regulator [Acidimicrobiaceae bacterium]|nr:TetR/AcrR family transcriptional regulator [Acidimicrobiaceae bacterium]
MTSQPLLAGVHQVSEMESRILDATKTSIERWGVSRFTVNDVCEMVNISRATIYRIFPGGKEVLLEALHVRSLDEFFATMLARTQGATSLEDLLVRCVVVATTELRNDEHLALMLATEPGTTLTRFTVGGMPRIVRVASAYLAPLIADFIPRSEADELVEVLVRLVISYFLAPSERFDFANQDSVAKFLRSNLNIHEFTK